MFLYVCVCMHVGICVYVYVCMHVVICVYVCVCVCVSLNKTRIKTIKTDMQYVNPTPYNHK